MKELNLSSILLENRHKRGITQEQLAAFLGVSKASVSKWETGATYPDITLLPRLASYFHISINELIGYQPQLAADEIRKLYRKLSADFSCLPFDQVMASCREIVRKYFSCPPLLFQMGTLYVNHSMLPEDPCLSAAVLEEARSLFVRAARESTDPSLKHQAVTMEAFCLLQLGHPKEVLKLLDPLESIRISVEPLLAGAYHMLGKEEASQTSLQAGIYHSLLELFGLLTAYLNPCAKDAGLLAETCRRMQALSDAFWMEELHPSLLLTWHLSAARSFLTLNETEAALEHLEAYVALACSPIYPLKLHGDSYFSRLDKWLEENFTLGTDLPRGEKIIRQSIKESLVKNPAFSCLAGDPRFKKLINRLNTLEEPV